MPERLKDTKQHRRQAQPLDFGRRSSGPDNLGLRRRVFVAPTDAEARDIVESADNPMASARLILQSNPNAAAALDSARSGAAANARYNRPDDIIVGSPETVTEQLADQIMATGIGHLLFFTDFKLFDHEDLVRSHDLIGAHVIPALRSLNPPASAPAAT